MYIFSTFLEIHIYTYRGAYDPIHTFKVLAAQYVSRRRQGE